MSSLLAVAAALLGLTIPADGPGDDGPAPSLSVRIVPTSFRERIGRVIELYRPSQHFQVVVTNVSAKPVRLWREWCSWGYFGLSFVVTDGDGNPVVVKKRARSWPKNYPDWTTLEPGDHMVFEVSFDEPIWQDAPMPEPGNSRPVRMKAVYEVRVDDETKEHEVWTGRVSSPEADYTVYR